MDNAKIDRVLRRLASRPTPIIRRATAGDVDTVARLYSAMLAEEGTALDVETVRCIIERSVDWIETCLVLLMEIDGQVVGQVCCKLTPIAPYRLVRTVCVWGLFIVPDRRGCGRGLWLIRAAMEYARALGAALDFHVTSQRRPNIYERLGGKPVALIYSGEVSPDG